MNLAKNNNSSFSLFGVPQRSNIQLTIKSRNMNQKRNHIEVSCFKAGSYLRFVISRSAVRVRSPAPYLTPKVPRSLEFFIAQTYQSLPISCNQKRNQEGVTCCKVIWERVMRNQMPGILSIQ